LTRIKKIINDLKEFSYVHKVEWQYADIHRGLNSTINVVWNEIKYKAELIKNYGDLPEIKCLPPQLNQVFLNILVNAAQSIKTRGRITISTGTQGDRVWIAISDTGEGIPEQSLSRIFEPFFTSKSVGKGTGLGLSLSYSIVQKHHGSIDVSSKIGEGTTFTVVLPIEQPKDTQ
jgi:signal transduction histidine kinase